MSAIIHIALGSNRRHGRHGRPVAVLAAAIVALEAGGLRVTARSATCTTMPLGPRQRRFANAVVAVATDRPLSEVLGLLQSLERAFGRRRGRRWGPRVLDLDLVAAEQVVTPRYWRMARDRLVVPHPALAERGFVLDPLSEIAGTWRHPVLHLTARQLRARLRRPRPTTAGSP